METKDIIRQVQKLEISTKHLVDGLVTGNYHSIFRGQGVEFSEIRDYRPGDDIRAIDWKVTARFNHPFVKEFIEERDLQVYFAIDFSGSGSFGSNAPKRARALEVAGSLMFAALRNNDKVGAFIFTDGIEKFIPARKGRKHVLKLLSILVSYEPKSKKTNIGQSLAKISKIAKRRGIVFIISDFIDADFTKALRMLRNRHDVIALRIMDERERAIPDVGLIELEDEETGEQLLVDTSSKEFRENFAKMAKSEEDNIRGRMRRAKADIITIYSDEAYGIPLKKFFRKRKMVR